MNRVYTAIELSQLFHGELSSIDPDQSIHAVSIDSRNILPGSVFFCIEGERTDGHLYIEQALQQGAIAIVASRSRYQTLHLAETTPLILVDDPGKALLNLAGDYRKYFTGKVLAITGSNGKTSTKELAANLLRNLDFKVHSTHGNYNNHIGVPLTLLAASLEEDWWVIEIGTNHFGEIESLSRVVQPTVSIITNVGESHLEFLKSTQGVAQEKASIVQGMTSGSSLFCPEDVIHREVLQAAVTKAKMTLKTYHLSHLKSEKKMSTHWALWVALDGDQKEFLFDDVLFRCSIPQTLFIKNLIGILSVMREEKIPMERLQIAVEKLKVEVSGRLRIVPHKDYLLIDDSYNANPTSFREVLFHLHQTYPERRLIAVVGPMAELGVKSAMYHFQVGQVLHQYAHGLFAFGTEDAHYYLKGWHAVEANSSAAMYTSNFSELMTTFKKVAQPGDLIFVKGSRSAHMEQFIDALS